MQRRAFLLLACAALASAAADPFLGTWVLNREKSSFGSEPGYEKLTVRWEDAGGVALKISAEGVQAGGRPVRFSYKAHYDGKEYPPTGPWNWDKVVNRRIDEFTREDTYFKDGRKIGTERRIVSRDGRTLRYEHQFGREVSTLVFDRR